MKYKQKDGSNILESVIIKFDNSKPIEVIDFLTSIQGFQNQYKKTLKSENLKYTDELKLYLYVREGCIEFEFVRLIGESVSKFVTDKIVKKTYEAITTVISNISNNKNVVEDVVLLENTNKVLSPAKVDGQSSMKFSYKNNQGDHLKFETNGVEAKEVCESLVDMIEQIKMPKHEGFNRETMKLAVTSKNIIKAKIETISEKEITIIGDDELKRKMLEENKENPFATYFIVTGRVKSAEGKIIAYDIHQIDEIIKDV